MFKGCIAALRGMKWLGRSAQKECQRAKCRDRAYNLLLPG